MHFGKTFPAQAKHLAIFGNRIHGEGPSRKAVLETFPPTVGAKPLESPWSGIRVVSEDVCDYWPDDKTWVHYRFVHPSNTDLVLTFRVRMEENGLTSPFANHYQWHSHLEYEYAGDVIAKNDWQVDHEGGNWINPHSDTESPLTWTSLTMPTQFERMRVRWGAAKWDDQPEFHPYRYEP